MIHKGKGFHIVNEAEDVFRNFLAFCSDPMDVGNLISGSSAFPKSSLNWIRVQHLEVLGSHTVEARERPLLTAATEKPHSAVIGRETPSRA